MPTRGKGTEAMDYKTDKAVSSLCVMATLAARYLVNRECLIRSCHKDAIKVTRSRCLRQIYRQNNL